MKRFLLLLAFVAAFPAVGQAHFLWLLTDAQQSANAERPVAGKVQVFFGEAAEPDDPDLLDHVVAAEVWSVGGRSEPKPIALNKGAESLEGELSGPARQSTLVLRHTYGVVAKGGEPFLLKYYAKAYPFPLPGTWQPVEDNERLPLEIVPQLDGAARLLLVTWNGKPQSGAEVTVIGPGIEDKLVGTTGDDGIYRCEFPSAGLFSIRARHIETAPGKLGDKEYQSVRHYSTLTLRYEPSRLVPKPHDLPSLPKGTTSFGGAIVGDSLFAFGGNYGGAHEFSNEEQSGDLWRLDLKNPRKWEQFAGGPKLQGLGMVVYQGQLYRVGGFTAMNKQNEKEDLRSQSDFARLDPAVTTWDALPSLPEPRSSHDAALIGSTLYVVGGWNMQPGGQGPDWHETALAVDLSANPLEWKAIAPSPFKRRALTLAACQDKLYCIGGMQEQGGPTTAVAVYDPAADAWSDGPEIMGGPMDGFGSAAFACQGALYVTTISGSIQRLAGDGRRWEYVGQLAHPRFFHRLLPWHDSKLVAVGGANMTTGKTEALELLSIDEVKTAAR